MRVYLLNLVINGIKNIEKPISIDFYKKSMSEINFDNYRVKGIFGKNGTGKTAIIKAIDIIKNIVLDKKYLIKNDKTIIDLINKKTKEMSVEIEFYFDNRKLKIINHKMIIAIENDELKIKYEHVEIKTLNNKVSKKIIQENGLVTNKAGLKIENNEYLSKQLLSNSFVREFNTVSKQENRKEDITYYIDTLYVIYNLVFTSEDTYLNDLDLEKVKENIRNFEKNLEGITKFLKLFSPKINDVSYEIRSKDEKKYYIDYIIKYDDYDISLEHESKGIKNLLNLYKIIKCAFRGGIIFIDEIDLSIHEVYLEKLIESVAEFSKGQLIFTSHNIGLLSTLNKYKNSINFIDSENNVKKWVQKGTLNPVKTYKEGRIDNMAFNIEAYEFYDIFN